MNITQFISLSAFALLTAGPVHCLTQPITPEMAMEIAKQARPNIATDNLGFATKILSDPRLQGQLVGHIGEGVYTAEHPTYRPHPVKNHPQVDLLGRNGLTGQVKMFADGDPERYWRAMLKDHAADRFLVPDDHIDDLRNAIRKHSQKFEARGQFAKAQSARQQLARIHPLGHTYDEYAASLARSARSVVARVATRTGGASGVLVCVLDGGTVIYDTASGRLSPGQTIDGLVDTGAKALAVGSATTITILIGANPVSFTVVVVGTGVYFISDYALDKCREKFASAPLDVETMKAFLPRGWSLIDDPRL